MTESIILKSKYYQDSLLKKLLRLLVFVAIAYPIFYVGSVVLNDQTTDHIAKANTVWGNFLVIVFFQNIVMIGVYLQAQSIKLNQHTIQFSQGSGKPFSLPVHANQIEKVIVRQQSKSLNLWQKRSQSFTPIDDTLFDLRKFDYLLTFYLHAKLAHDLNKNGFTVDTKSYHEDISQLIEWIYQNNLSINRINF